VPSSRLGAAAQAFDACAPEFDRRFAPWASVQAQRRAVRRALTQAFPRDSRLIEIGGGTGEDALWLTQQGRSVLLTDASPAMIEAASAKCRDEVETAVVAADDLGKLAERLTGESQFDGAYSVFAALNCVSDLSEFGRGLARLLRPGAPLMLVVFGTCCPGEIIVELARGRPGNAFRRFNRGDVPARLGTKRFTVRYHRGRDLQRMLAPYFRLERREGIGIFVPPSAAEPWISRHPRLLRTLEALDRRAQRSLVSLADHILYRFVRNAA
jgi:SAM-dependent methyltransferase